MHDKTINKEWNYNTTKAYEYETDEKLIKAMKIIISSFPKIPNIKMLQ